MSTVHDSYAANTISNSVCSNCAKVDLKDLLFGHRHPHVHYESLRTLVGNLGDILANCICPLCRLISFAVSCQNFAAVLEEAELSSNDIDCYLEPWRADAAEGTPFVSDETQAITASSLVIHLQVHEGANPDEIEYFHPVDIKIKHSGVQHTRSLLNGAEAAYPVADLGLAKDWIAKCQKFHTDICGNLEYLPGNLEDAYRKSFHLIDVTNRTVIQVDPLTIEYAALSYVWGYSQGQYATIQSELAASRDGQSGPRNLPNSLPNTIEDAMAVCSGLDLQFLWVDLFCVDQTASEEQKIQLRNMGNTYKRAVVTIISAFGIDSQAGIPGVRGYPSNVFSGQACEQVEGLELITGLPTLSDQMSNSKWGERGWTFQEGLLSTRCLIFGGYEPIFYCRKGQCRQSLQLSPMDHNHRSGHSLDTTMEQLEHYPLSTPIFSRKDADGEEWTFGDYTQIVKGYLLREVTRESDTLAALEGYLNVVTQRTGMKFVWGLPVQHLVDALSWCGPCVEWRRLEIFPSWTWAGWSLSWRYWPFFETARYGHSQPSSQTRPNGHLPSCLVYLSGDDYPRHRPENPVLQWSAIVRVYPSNEQRRLEVESYVAKFELVPIDPYKEPEWGGPDEAPLTTPPMTIFGKNGPVTIEGDSGEQNLIAGRDFSLFLPINISIGTFEWLMSGPMEFVMLKRWEEQYLDNAPVENTGFNYVLAMLVDRRSGDIARRIGIMAIPAEEWDYEKAGVELKTIILE